MTPCRVDRHLGALILASLAFLLTAAGRGELQQTLPQVGLPTERETWRQFDAPSFTIFSSASKKRTLAIARQLEGLRSALGHVTQLEVSSPVPTRIYIFADNASLNPYKHLYDGQPASMSGALYSRPWGDYIAMNGARRAEASVTVFHEYVHVVLRNNLPGLPLWLEEGLAEFFSTFRLEQGGGRLGRPVPWHLDELRRGELAPLRSILSADVSSELYNRFEHQGEFYARSWELTHYLLLGPPKRLDQALDFLSRSFQGMPLDTAFKAAFGVDIDTLDAELAAYRVQGYRSSLLPLPKADFEAIQTRDVAYPELLFRLAELLTSQSGRTGDASFHYRQALERRPDFGLAVTGLGLLAQQEGDLPRARALFARAVTMTDAPSSHYFYGKSLLSLGRAVSQAKRQEARRHLEHSVRLDPSFAPAWVSLALARYFEAPRGESEVPQTAASLPSSPEVALDVLMLYSRSRDRQAAQQLWDDYFKPRVGSSERRAAAQVLARLDWLERGGPSPPILRAIPAAPPPGDIQRKPGPPPRRGQKPRPHGM